MGKKIKEDNNIIKFPGKDITKDDFDDFEKKFSERFAKEEESYAILEKIEEASSLEEAFEYINKALEVYPDNMQAKMYLLDFKINPVEKLRDINVYINEEKEKLEKQGLFEKENIGDFWLIFETRTYMRLKYNYIEILIKIRRYNEAIKECEELLKLCKNDNMGIRYKLMTLYVFKNDFIKAEKLYKKFKEQCILMSFPLSFCAYENEDYDKTRIYLSKAAKANKNLIPYFKGKKNVDKDKIINILINNEEYYEEGSIEEILILLNSLSYIFNDRMDYFNWIEENM